MAPNRVTSNQMSDAIRLISWGVVQAVLVDNKEPPSEHMRDVMERCVQENLQQCEKWTASLLEDLLASNTAVADIRALNDHMRDYLTQCFRQRNSSLSSGLVERGKPTEPHINILRKMNYDLTRCLKLEGTLLLDRLYECDMMSESERQSILAKATDKRKNEAFVEFLCSNFTTEKFKASILPILSEEQVHTDLAERIIAELESASTNSESIRCTFCTMKAIVNPRKLSEVLFQHGSISLSVKHDLCLSTQPNSSKWELLLKNVQKEKKLLDALEKSYEHLFREFQETEHPVLRCCCFNMRPGVADMADFTSEATSVRPELNPRLGQNLLQVDMGLTQDSFRCALDIESSFDDMETDKCLLGETINGLQEDITGNKELNSYMDMLTEIRQDIQKYKADAVRLELEYSVNKHILQTELNMVEAQDMKIKMGRISCIVSERKQFIKHAENFQRAIKEPMVQLEHEREVVDIANFKVNRKLKSELKMIQRAYLEKRTKMELACDMIWENGGRRHD